MVPLILLATVLLGSVAEARVSFMSSEVLQQTDVPDYGDKAPFKCDNGCQVYTDSRSSSLYITKLNTNTGVYEAVTTFSNIGGANKQNPAPYALKASDKYYVDNRGDLNPFVFYVVDNEAPNMGTPVMVITDDAGLKIDTTAERVTVLSSKAAAHTWSQISAKFGETVWGRFPKIYATGFDNVDVDYCEPVYWARSVETLADAAITLPTPISTIHFLPGDTARHTVNVAWNKNAAVAHTLTTAYVTPGYHGCAFNVDELYSSSLNATLSDSFTIRAKSVLLSGYIALPNTDVLDFKINDAEIFFRGWALTPQCWENADSYAISLNWTGRSKGASFAVQLDFDAGCQ
ncbi:hypothetical protein PRIPAC_87295 [Pristionchus pacificus]|uniref:Uncharacterized protein n=1 Tax=Pristionchus pacificus TaxID=54126 RepID=A0A2A6B8Q0_PRIPA|nr:hypothetical protein PRIPAC_87295 [Pristionchus pacificus]|eukprot:PDM62233.1 hypothetical protein PRIPAC_51675 [Pristionchus pacificus]